MTIRSVSTINLGGSVALARFLTAIVFLAILPGVKADCWFENDGTEHCNGLSSAARAGIGLGFFLVFLGLLAAILVHRRRQSAQANLIYVQQSRPQGGGNQQYGFGPGVGGGGGGGQGFYGPPQYPPQAYNNGAIPYPYDPSTGFAPPAGNLPPQYYAPPPGPPPNFDSKGQV
ncbi:hypothetical protein B0F90DRAFT_1744784 [Multifurca ochricompacta]|uniref:Transmembrane protein n=1 Tax=Multifurca ochricompacta TaxID=376703 RepID=A0AAD4M0B6_9AGAM|nr:hypothetical protein B0F90DRAFT_1744784 [Multifurca ochricompacta]